MDLSDLNSNYLKNIIEKVSKEQKSVFFFFQVILSLTY